jgi:exodeoxyribonuclease V alpha subunit
VIAGGPGSGKTTAVARIVALLDEQARVRGRRPPLVGMVAPTGKAAARLEEAVHAEALRLDLAPPVRQRLLSVRASTLHRLLGARPDSASRFRHHHLHRLPHDVIIVDETSMVSLSLMARLVEAVRSDARLVLVGDPEQLASVEAGAVLGDIAGPSLAGLRMTPAASAQLQRITGVVPSAPVGPAQTAVPGVGDSVVVLRANYRFRGILAELADTVRNGDGDRAVALLSSGDPSLRWAKVDDAVDWAGPPAAPALEPIRAAAIALGAALLEAATARNGEGALDSLARFRVLCAHRHGPTGVSSWTDRIEGWLSAAVPDFVTGNAWYLGRPVMVTANDYGLRLFNGDTGVVLAREDCGVTVAFRQGGSLVAISPARLSSVQTVFAMTVHKAQGSEFSRAAVVLPASTSAVLTRQLLYTAVTRAQDGLLLVGSEQAIRAAVSRPVARASGLTDRLWGSGNSDSGSLHLARQG